MRENERAMLEQLIESFANRPLDDWFRIVLNCEIKDVSGDRPYMNHVFFAVIKAEEGFVEHDLMTEMEEEELIYDLRGSMAKTSSDAWGTMDLEIDEDGTYRVDFDYGPPRRLNGILDEKSIGRFNEYTRNLA